MVLLCLGLVLGIALSIGHMVILHFVRITMMLDTLGMLFIMLLNDIHLSG